MRPTLIRAQKRRWLIQTAGRWPWKSESAKECVTTHLPNQLALKMDGAERAAHTRPSGQRVFFPPGGRPRRVGGPPRRAWKGRPRGRPEPPRAQILVVVANIRVRSSRAEWRRRVPCEQQLYMGQSILSPREVPLRAEAGAPLLVEAGASPPGRKGIGSIFPNPEAEPSVLRGGPSCKASEPADAGRGPGKSFLFLVRGGIPGIGLSGARGCGPVERRVSGGVRRAPAGP